MALVGTFGLNFQVILPLLARFTFDGGPGAYAALLGAMGAGSVVGALITAAHGRTGLQMVSRAAFVFGVLSLVAAVTPSLAIALPVLAGLGGAAVTFAAGVNSTLQLAVSEQMRGRVMALYSIVFLGSTPIGGPIAGVLSEAYSPRAALVLAASAGLAAAWAARRAGQNLSDPPRRGASPRRATHRSQRHAPRQAA
jgi:MFS family permease